MSEHDASRNSPNRRREEMNSSHDANMDDAADTGSANNSIIGKVKSRVSSILPTSLSKWFSPSAKNNDSINGSLNRSVGAGIGGGYPRRRRHIELEDDEDEGNGDDVEDEDANGEELHYLLEGNTSKRHSQDNSDDDDEEDSNNSDEEATLPGKTSASPMSNVSRGLKAPPAKRSRFDLDITQNMRDSPLMQRQPLVASTPAGGGIGRSTLPQSSTMSMSRPGSNRYSHMGFYSAACRKDTMQNLTPSVIVNETRCEPRNATIDVNESMPLHLTDTSQSAGLVNTGINSRRSLNITSHYPYTGGLSNLKRQSLASVKNDLPSTSAGIMRERSLLDASSGALPKRTSTTIFEAEESGIGDDGYENKAKLTTTIEEGEPICGANNDCEQADTSIAYNGRLSTTALMNKRPRLINGGQYLAAKSTASDTASECSESAQRTTTESLDLTGQHKTGLFNMSTSATNIRSGNRNLFCNDLNFYTHLEGRKSLFARGSSGAGIGPAVQGAPNILNNSTLSLTSLNRRQFNASIYGSTSALSDSRLLNTFSPFYKGRTTYGGASAYHKYDAVGGAAAGGTRIARTRICPTSSLSTLSSSNNSLGTIGAGTGVAAENLSAISSTAKRILDLINDFATPLSEAKKMANNLKSSKQQLLPQAKSRLNESDLQIARAQRLAQVRKPYMRPVITLQPMVKAGLMNDDKEAGPMPPVRELQVPSMSQLLQMKKLQSSTERSRQIATKQQQLTTPAYTLPFAADIGGDGSNQPQQKQHTSKIKSAKHNQMHVAAVREHDDEPPPPVNLPNIVFPLMKSVPKIDIPLPKISTNASEAMESSVKSNTTAAAFAFKKCSVDIPKPTSATAATHSKWTKSCEGDALNSTNVSINFKFSLPLALKCTQVVQQAVSVKQNFTFSEPAEVPSVAAVGVAKVTPALAVSQLKSGSVLDALKKPLVLPTFSSSSSEAITSENNGFGQQFKKSADEWECDSCMLRNKQEANKCVACETSRINPAATSCKDTASAVSFGSQFKRSTNEWECQTCLIRNKREATKCVACEVPRKDPNLPQLAIIKSSFGDAFKQKANTWECSTCLIKNQNQDNECAACQTKKPGTGSTNSTGSCGNTTSAHKFGLTPDSSTATIVAAPVDAGFKSLAAAQKSSKWECEACMTLNEASRSKCICCDQAKPGSQTINSDVPKFSFGATAAAKFSFGFGAVAGVNGSKEADLRKSTEKTEVSPKMTSGFVFGTSDSTAASGVITFGIKPSTGPGKDVADFTAPSAATSTASFESGREAKPTFKFGVSSVATSTNSGNSIAASTETTTGAPKGFSFGIPAANNTTTTTKSTQMIVSSVSSALPLTSTVTSTPRVKLSSATTTSVAASIAPTFSFSSPVISTSISTISTTLSKPAAAATGGFNFSTPPKPVTAVADTNKKPEVASALANSFDFKAPTSTSSAGKTFGFDASKTKAVATVATSCTTTTAAVKPIFNFGAGQSSPSVAASTINSSTSFSFGSATTPAAARALFPAAASAATATPSVASALVPAAPTSATSASPAAAAVGSSLFGSFSSSPKSASGKISGNFNPPSSGNLFASFGGATNESKTAAANSFCASTNESKAMASADQIFGSTSNTVAAGQPTSTATPFVFGGSMGVTATATDSTATNTSAGVAASTWPESGFVFGNAAANNATNTNGNELTAKSVFGTFGSAPTASSHPSSAAGSSIFGNMSSTPQTSSGFGNIATSGIPSSTSLFGTNTAPSATAPGSGTSLFGVPTTSSASATSAVAFGASPFGSGSSINTSVSTFGGATAGTTNFGNFSATNAVVNSAVSVPSNSDGASAPKKSESTFNFGTTTAAETSTQQGSSGGFNFGTAATKPAFNFAPTNQPAFNFTGSTDAAKPFQFGATPSAPMFNFSAGAAEATPNAPFQFNAGATPATNNIFAPTPTAGAPGAQQARRKIRAPNRRLTPR